MTTRFLAVPMAALFACMIPSAPARAAGGPVRAPESWAGPLVEVLVDGVPRPEYRGNGQRYIEAVRERDYSIRITNPFPVRVAVALSVDGLNSIDARHTSAAAARKWVLEPYERIVIDGWQVSSSQARRFRFTSEARSYGQWLGQTSNLGVITAAFFRERVPEPVPILDRLMGMAGGVGSAAPAAPAPSQAAKEAGASSRSQADSSAAKGRDEYAATGLGARTDHPVQVVSLDLETQPAASAQIRYEYREQLVRLGLLPEPWRDGTLARRERARGFDGGFCPEPKR